MKQFKITWVELTEYEAFVFAPSKEEAEKRFHDAVAPGSEPTGWTQMEEDSLEIEEVNE